MVMLNMNNKFSILFAVGLLACGSALAQNAAMVNGKPIPKSMLDQFVQRSGQPDSPELRDRIRTMLVDRELVLQAAEKQGLAKQAAIKEQIDQARTGVLAAAVFENYAKAHAPAESELKSEYDKIKAAAVGAKEYKVRHILVEKESDAKALIAKLKDGAKFEDLAKASSKDQGSAASGGDLGWANPEGLVPEFARALTNLRKGDYTTTPVKTQFGWHIIKQEDVRDLQIPPYDQVKGELAKRVMADPAWQRDKFQAMMKEMHSKATIK